MAGSTRAKGAAARQLITVVVLFLLLIALAVAYYLITRPPQLEGQGQRDRQFLFSIYGFEGDLLRRPGGVGFDDDGNIYVADTGKKRVVVFDGSGNFLRVFGEAGKAKLQLWGPIDVAVTPDGRAWVVDRENKKLVEYDRSGRATREITVEEAPTGVTIANNLMFVTTDSGVLISDLNGNLETGYIKRGKKNGEFDRPAQVAVGKDGTMYVADSLNYRVQAINDKGKVLWTYGKPIPANKAVQFDSKDRKFGLPASIALDENGMLYVVDGLNMELVVLDSATGEFVEKIGDMGHADGTFYYPDGIAYSGNRLAIADRYNDRVEVFRTPTPPGQAWKAYVPYALLLLLLPLLLIPFLIRRQRYVLAPSAATLLAADEGRDAVAAAMKAVTVTSELAQWGVDETDLDLKWNALDADEDDVATIQSTYGIAAEEAEAVVIAAGMKGKRVLIGEGAALKKAAEDLQVPLVTYSEIKEVLAEKAKKKSKKTPESVEPAVAQEGDE